MNNVNMGGMPAMGGPVGGGGMPTMNNGTGPGVRQSMSANDNRSQLNTYIYEYFLKNGMYDCARSLIQSGQPMSIAKGSPGGQGDGSTGDDGGDAESKDDVDSKRPSDLPAPNLPMDTESCFLYEWWCLFWDMFNATRGKGDARSVLTYVTHTQAASRARQEQQQNMLRSIRGDAQGGPQNYQNMMMRNVANSTANNELRVKAFQNNRNAPQNMQMVQQKQQQMQRDPSNQDGQQRAQSPGSAENAPSPSKRPRLDPNFNSQQQMPNGRGQGMPQQVGDSGPSNVQAAHMQLTNGLEPNSLTAPQFQNMPGGNSTAQARSLGAYQANLAQQQQSQMPGAKGAMQNPGGPQSQGSPMMGAGREGPGIADYYNPGDLNGMRGGAPGPPGQPGGNHALQDYQMQLMLLEQQNKKRLMMARQEQDSMSGGAMPRADGSQGPPQMGPNGQQQFTQGTSPQGPRSVNSPNPNEQMKRGNPNMPGGMPSPLPEGQSRGSPNNGMGFNLPNGPMDPNMNPQYFTKMGGMGDPNMVPGGVMPNGMRPPPSSHPGNGFNNVQPLNPQHAAMLRQAQAAQQQGGWQGPNGQMGQQPQGGPQQGMVGGPQQQRAMPPPSAPTPTMTNGRTQPSSPQQPAPPTPQANNKPAPKKKNTETKETKAKRAAQKKGSAPNNAGATPSAEDAAGATPTPQTPITPVHTFNKVPNGAVQPPNGQAPAQPNVAPQPDMFNGNFGNNDFPYDSNSLTFNDSLGTTDVLQDFDFDSFLHQDVNDNEAFNFDGSGLEFGDGIGAE